MSATATTSCADLDAWFACDFPEVSYDVGCCQGSLPRNLRGTYYVNGPAKFVRNGQRSRHWLDGDGMVCALRLGDTPSFSARFVRTRKFVEEEAAGRFVFRTFGAAFPDDRSRHGIATESPCNISVHRWANQLLAFGEQSMPIALDPVTLATRGHFDFGGAINEITPFSAHPKIDADTGELICFGVSFSTVQPCLSYYRFDSHAGLLCRRRVNLAAPYYVHDFALSKDFAIFYLSPYLFNIDAVVRHRQPPANALHWAPNRASQLLIISRETGQQVAKVNIGTGYCLHTINSAQRRNELLVDVLEYPSPLFDQYQPVPYLFTDVQRGMPVRYVLDTATWRLRARLSLAHVGSPDFPCIDPSDARCEYENFWMLSISSQQPAGPRFFDRLVRANWTAPHVADVYDAPDGCYLAGEPAFVADPDDRTSGTIICHEFSPTLGISSFVIFDAYAIAQGPLARIRLEDRMPLGFHSVFCRE